MKLSVEEIEAQILLQDIEITGDLSLPKHPKGLIIFAHGSGSSRKSPRNRFVAKGLNHVGYATLLFDLLSPEEERNRRNVFNISFLSKRLIQVSEWTQQESKINKLPIGYFGASTGAAAALIAATKVENIFAIVSRGGRPDLAFHQLKEVECPVLLIVGGHDYEVINLNKKAKSLLRNCDLSIVSRATHLFEEPGALDDVIHLAIDWFDQKLADYQIKKKINQSPPTLDERYKSFTSADDLQPLLKKLSKSKIVMLGEATHGTEEFYALRRKISQSLIEDYGFNFIAVEGDWPDCYYFNQYVTLTKEDLLQEFRIHFKRWPSWMWANEQIFRLIEWMQGHRARFYGLDLYSFYESLDRLKSYSEILDEDIAKKISRLYSCLDSFDRDEITYARSLIKYPKGCESEILENLKALQRLHLSESRLDKEELFDIQQNAKIIHNAEKYYRAMVHGEPNSWNIRDNHMIDTLDSLIHHHGEDSKAIVWAHNTHIGDYRATDMPDQGYVNLGGLARERYGVENVALVGFGTYEGEVIAGAAWGAKPEKMKIPPAHEGTYENDFHQICKILSISQFYIMFNGDRDLREKKGHRAIGVVYQTPKMIKDRHFVPTELANRYDAFIFIDKSTPLKILSEIKEVKEEGTFPETWPGGV